MIATLAVIASVSIGGDGACPEPADVARRLTALAPGDHSAGEVRLSTGSDGALRIELGAPPA